MKEKHNFLMPDYYPSFSCKTGKCRKACCTGWQISFSLEDYYRLASRSCSKKLREMIDRGLHVADYPTNERYAFLSPRYDGDCYLRRRDGMCALHCELGEDALTDVCRLYPRGIRQNEDKYEISCANSCEAVLELMFAKDAPISFFERELEISMPPYAKRENIFDTLGRAYDVRMCLIRLIQDRRIPMLERLFLVKRKMQEICEAIDSRDKELLSSILSENETENVKEQVGKNDEAFFVRLVSRLAASLEKASVSTEEYTEKCLDYFKNSKDLYKAYSDADARFTEKFPKNDVYFEHMLVNHMFFTEFPYEDRPMGLEDEFCALCFIYFYLRFIAVGYMAQGGDIEDLVDVFSACFRFIEHSDFERRAVNMIKHEKSDDEMFRKWISA